MTYAADRLFEEVAYVAYHFHWSMDEILDLERNPAPAGRLGQAHADLAFGASRGDAVATPRDPRPFLSQVGAQLRSSLVRSRRGRVPG